MGKIWIKKIGMVLAVGWIVVFAVPARAAMTSQNYMVDDARIGTGEVSVSHAASANYMVDASSIDIDTTPPVTTDNTDSSWHNSSVTITLTCNDNGGSGCANTYYTTDGSAPTTASSQGTSINLSGDGQYTIKYFSVDNDGNTETVKTATNQVKIDTTNPATTASPLGGTYGAAQTVTLTCDDNGGSGCDKIYYTTDGSDPTISLAQYATPLSIGNTATLKFFATDLAGNSETTESETYTIDSTYPVTTITSNPASVTNATSATFDFSANKAGSTFECKLDDDSFSPCTSPQSYSNLSDDVHEFTVRATDTLGHVEPTPPTYDWTVDTTPPDIDSYTPIASYTNNTSPEFSFHTTEGGNITYTNCPANNLTIASAGDNIVTFNNLAAGSYANCQIKITDSANNTSDILTIPTFTVDTTPPNLTNITPTSQTFAATTASTTLNLTTSEPATCKYSNSSNTAYADMTHAFDSPNVMSQSAFISGLTPGQAYTYYVRCSDRAGNVTTTDDTFTFSISSAPAKVSLNSVKITVARAVNKFKDTIRIVTNKFKLKSQDSALANGTVKIYEGKSLWKTVTADASGAWQETLKLSNNADKKIKLFFYDAFGNLLGTQKAQVKVDTEAPKFKSFITSGYSVQKGSKVYWQATDNQKVDHFKIYFNGHITTRKDASYTIPGATPPGSYTIKVRVYDQAGNSSSKETNINVLGEVHRAPNLNSNNNPPIGQNTSPAQPQTPVCHTSNPNQKAYLVESAVVVLMWVKLLITKISTTLSIGQLWINGLWLLTSFICIISLVANATYHT